MGVVSPLGHFFSGMGLMGVRGTCVRLVWVKGKWGKQRSSIVILKRGGRCRSQWGIPVRGLLRWGLEKD